MAKSRSVKSSKTKQEKQSKKSRLQNTDMQTIDAPDTNEAIANEAEQASDDVAIRFVGQWNRLISTTNWEKGRIICQWREALMTAGVPVTQYSDETWAQLVGNVTSQHVGRLRRVFQRFGDVFDQYEGLYWSHFQAALDWDDAEMWLEGAIQNQWSVSQTRGKRWETLGTPTDQQVQEFNEEIADVETLNEDVPFGVDVEESAIVEEPIGGERETSSKKKSDQQASETENSTSDVQSAGTADTEAEPSAQSTARNRQRLDVALDDLPDDIAEAFEQFKLAIIAQRREGWQEISPNEVVECLDALKQLVLAE